MSYRRQPRNKTDQKQRAANNLNHSDKWRHDLRSRNADFHKASASEGVREEKLLYVFGKETQPARMRISETAFAARSPQIVAVVTGIGR